MAINKLYFIPTSEIIDGPTGTTIHVTSDFGNGSADNEPNQNTVTFTGVHERIEIEDDDDRINELDFFNFFGGTQKLAANILGFDASDGLGIETLYQYDLEGSDGSTLSIIAIHIGTSTVSDQPIGYLVTAEPKVGITYTVKNLVPITNPKYSDLVTCFTKGTLIKTPDSEIAVEHLRVGQEVSTKDHGAQTIRWLGHSTADLRDGRHEHLRPIRIEKGALGANIPCIDLIVSPQHRILVRSKIAQRMFCASEVLVAAKQLLGVEGISLCNDLACVDYYHIMLDKHEILRSNGAETESLYLGSEARKTISPAGLREINTLFPELLGEEAPSPARLLVAGRRARSLAQRHAQNHKLLVS